LTSLTMNGNSCVSALMMLTIIEAVAADVPSSGMICSMMASTARIASEAMLLHLCCVDGSGPQLLDRSDKRVVDRRGHRLARGDRRFDLRPRSIAGPDRLDHCATVGGRAHRLWEFLRDAIVAVIDGCPLQRVIGIGDDAGLAAGDGRRGRIGVDALDFIESGLE